MAVEKFYKDSNGDYVKVIQESETLSASEEANLRNQLQGNKKSSREKVTEQIKDTKTTTAGRPIYKDKETGENYSERSTTIQMEDGKWLTIPTVNTSGGQFDVGFLEDFVRRNGPKDPLTGRSLPTFDSEPEATSYAKQRSNSLVPERRISPKLYTKKGKFRGADYNTGVDSGEFRSDFHETNNFKERTKFLDQAVGKDGYVVDKMGNFLLTQKGRSTVGQEGNNLLAIDADRFEVEDFSDFFGEYGDVVLGSIAGELVADAAFRKTTTSNTPIGRLLRKGHFGKANKLGKILGKTMGIARPSARIGVAALGGAGGAYVGNVLSEAQQVYRNVSDESWKDIQDRGVMEAKLAGGFSVLGQLAGKGIGTIVRTKGATKFTKEVYGEQAYKNWEESGILKADENSIMDRVQRGYLVDIFNEIESPVRGRIMAAIDAIGKGNLKRDKVNARAALKELKEQFPSELKNFSDEELIETLSMHLNGEGKLLKKALKANRANLGAAAADGLGALLKLSQKGEIPIADIADMYETINQAVALSSVEAMKTAEVLGRKGLENADSLFVTVDQAIENMGAQLKNIKGSSSDITNNSINYLKGIKGSNLAEDMKVLVSDSGEILLISDGGAQNFIGTQRITQELLKVKNAFPEAIIEEGGPLAKIWNNIDADGNIVKPVYISPTESNLLIQQMRKISLDGSPGSKFDTRKLWDAAIEDNDIAVAMFDNAVNQGKAGKIIGRPSVSFGAKTGTLLAQDKAFINKGLGQMDEYIKGVKDITTDNKAQMKIFEEYGIGELALRVADGEVNYNNLIDVLLDPNNPESLESFMKFFTETIKKQRRSIYNPSDNMSGQYKDIAFDDAGQPIRTVKGAQKTAYDAIESGPMDSQVSDILSKPGSRQADKIAQEGKINFVNSNMSIDEIESFVKDELKRATLKRMVNEKGQISLTNIRNVIDELGVENISKPGTPTTLVSLFGKKTAQELLDFSENLDNVVSGIDIPKDIADRLQKGLGQVNRLLNDANPQGLDEALEGFSKAQRELDKWNNDQFVTKLRDQDYKLVDGSDFNQFVDDLFSGDRSTKDIEKVINKMAPEELEQLQSRVMNKFISDLGFDSLDTAEEISLQDVAKLFSDKNVEKVIGRMNPKRFNIVFKKTGGKGASFKGKNPFETLQTIARAAKKSTKSTGMGSIVAAAFAMNIAGAPLAMLVGGLTLSGAAVLTSGTTIATGAAIIILSRMMLRPRFMEILATSALPQKTLTRGQAGRQITAKTLRNLSLNLPRDRKGDREKMGPSASDIKEIGRAQGIKERAYNVGAKLSNPVGKAIAAGPNIANNLVNQFTGGSTKPRYKAPTKLPNVKTFDDTIYSERDRRQALAGSNPNTQDIAGRR